jgi:pretoxin HINT domain-containing protein
VDKYVGGDNATAIATAAAIVGGWWLAGRILAGGAAGVSVGSQLCFAAGTLVHVGDQLVPIEDVKPGDRVWAMNTETNEVSLQTVLQTSVTENQDVGRITISTESGATASITATPAHPFWTRRGWLEARDVSTSDELYSVNGMWNRVIAVETLAERTTVFNLEVDQLHTYFVGVGGVLVHNNCEREARMLSQFGAMSTRALQRYAGELRGVIDNYKDMIANPGNRGDGFLSAGTIATLVEGAQRSLEYHQFEMDIIMRVLGQR